MKISEYQSKKKNLSTLIIIFVIFIFSAFAYLLWITVGNKLFQTTTLKIESGQSEVKVKIDSKDRGKTPLSLSSISVGSHFVELYKEEPFYSSWGQNVTFATGIEPYINREIGPSSNFSAGEVVYFKKDESGFSFVSNPEEVSVIINNENIGSTPLFLPSYTEGNYEVTFLKEGYQGRKITLRVKSGFSTHVSIDLFQIPEQDNPEILRQTEITNYPQPENIITREGWKADEGLKQNTPLTYSPLSKISLYDLSVSDEMLFNNPKTWVKGLYYYEVSYLGKSDLEWHYLIDREGVIYEGKAGGFEVAISGQEGLLRIGYLGKSDEGLTEKAQIAYAFLSNNQEKALSYKANIKESNTTETQELEATKTKSFGIVYKNLGDSIWYDRNPKKVFLKSENSKSIFYNSSDWVDKSIIKILPTAFVAKDQEVRFDFTVLAPNEDGEKAENFALYVEKNGELQKIEGSEFAVKIKVIGGVQKMVLIKDTGTGYLNVRDKAGLSGGVIDRVTPGEKYLFVEEVSGWVKIKLKSGTEGWVSSQFTERVN